MRNRLFGVNNPVTHCAPKRVRKTWGWTVLTVMTLLLLALLCGWLWSCVRHATVALPGPGWSRSLAMAPVPQGLMLSLTALLIALAVRRTRQHDAEAELRWTAQETRCVRLGLEALREIVNACRAESRVALLFVEAALTTTSLDDYADALRAAHEKLAQVTRTLGELQRSLTVEPQGGTTNPEWPSVARREDVA